MFCDDDPIARSFKRRIVFLTARRHTKRRIGRLKLNNELKNGEQIGSKEWIEQSGESEIKLSAFDCYSRFPMMHWGIVFKCN